MRRQAPLLRTTILLVTIAASSACAHADPSPSVQTNRADAARATQPVVASGSPVRGEPGAGEGGSAKPGPGRAGSGQAQADPGAAAAQPGAAMAARPGAAMAARPAGGPAACTAATLRAEFQAVGVGNGTRRGAVGVRNQSAAPCVVKGFLSLQLLGRGDDPISTQTLKDGKAVGPVLLNPDQTAWAAVSWTTAPAGDEPPSGGCQPAASRLAVNLPNDQTTLYTPFDAGPVCNHGLFTVGPLSARQPANT